MIELIPILQTGEENADLANNPAFKDVIIATTDYYKKIGFTPPWIGYFVKLNGEWVGSAGYKGKPLDGAVEIAYGTFPEFENRGIGTQICQKLVKLALLTDSQIKITARTLPDNFPSIAVLKKNGFDYVGIVSDKDDGDVLEWLYRKPGINTN